MNRQDLWHWLELCATTLHEQSDYLTRLDAAIGDADHGTNMDRGFQAVLAKSETLKTQDMATQLKTIGTTLVSTVGGASGPLYGTAFLRASAAVTGKDTLNSQDLVALLEAFLNGALARGKAQVGEKTMIDALTPAVEAACKALTEDLSLSEIASCASLAAEKGMKDTIPLQATKGRASYLGERSIGHQDPGATSSWLILRCLASSVAV